MKKLNYIFYTAGVMIILFSCKPNLKVNPVSSGEADFSRYVAIGNSLTAGYTDGALYKDGQINSYPNMLASQFMQAGGEEEFFNTLYECRRRK
ncbi:hypothetical protein EMGBS15_11820 [Filimonas sp.]|nr:hypothetical protein EMGBS15_11820 [Filimonas sp.]